MIMAIMVMVVKSWNVVLVLSFKVTVIMVLIVESWNV